MRGNMPFPNAVIFDMDGLMLDSEVLYQKAWKAAAAELGYQLDDSLYLSLIGRSNVEAEALFLKIFGADFPAAKFDQRWEASWRQSLQAEGVPLKPGLLELLDWLEKQEIPKAVGTSSKMAEAELCLSLAGICDRFSIIVTVDQVAAGKPEPDIFREAAKRIGVSPVQCLVLEDSNAGVQAANHAGMSVIMVPDLQIPTDQSKAMALRVLPSLCDVLAWLQSL